jgi:hypothetical protein
VVTLVVLLGCQHPAAEQELKYRRDNLDWTTRTLAERERVPVASQRLHYTDQVIRESIQQDVLNTGRDARALKAYLDFDVQRFRDRQREYRDTINEGLWGKPEEIEPSAIFMFL